MTGSAPANRAPAERQLPVVTFAGGTPPVPHLARRAAAVRPAVDSDVSAACPRRRPSLPAQNVLEASPIVTRPRDPMTKSASGRGAASTPPPAASRSVGSRGRLAAPGELVQDAVRGGAVRRPAPRSRPQGVHGRGATCPSAAARGGACAIGPVPVAAAWPQAYRAQFEAEGARGAVRRSAGKVSGQERSIARRRLYMSGRDPSAVA